jgi:hypothetical protein
MENEAVSSMKIAISLMVISLLIFCIYLIINIVRPTVYDKVISIVNAADEEYEKRYEDYSQTVVSGTKVVRLIKESENLGIGVIYQTCEMEKQRGYAKNIGTVFEGATAEAPFYNNNQICTKSELADFEGWKYQRRNGQIGYTSYYLKKEDSLVKCNNYASSVFSKDDMEYIALDGRFYSELIKDTTGKVIGIVFTQQ